MQFLKSRLAVLARALGARRYMILAILNGVGLTYEALRLQFGLAWLPDYPAFLIGLAVTVLLVIWWLVQRSHELETEIAPKIAIDFESVPPYVITDPWAEATGAAVRYVRVKVRNLSTTRIRGCLFRLESIKDHDGRDGYYTPVALITQHQYLQRRRGGPFTLDGKAHKFVNVASLDEREPGAPIALMYETVTAENPYPNAIRREHGPFLLEVCAYAGNANPVRKQFRLSVSTEGRLTMEEANVH